MFMQFATPKGENLLIPTSKITLISEDRKGVTIVLDDGTPIAIADSFATIVQRFLRREMLLKIKED